MGEPRLGILTLRHRSRSRAVLSSGTWFAPGRKDPTLRTWLLWINVSLGMHVAALTAVSSWLGDAGDGPPRAIFPPGQAQGMRVFVVDPQVIEARPQAITAQPPLAMPPTPKPGFTEDSRLREAAPTALRVPTDWLIDTADDSLDIAARQFDHQLAVEQPTSAAQPAWYVDPAPACEVDTPSDNARADVGRPAPGGAPGMTTQPIASSTNRMPAYPLEARRKKQAGTVVLTMLVDTDGSVDEPAVLESSDVDTLDAAALAASRTWHFTAAREGGQAVPVRIRYPVHFVLRTHEQR